MLNEVQRQLLSKQENTYIAFKQLLKQKCHLNTGFTLGVSLQFSLIELNGRIGEVQLNYYQFKNSGDAEILADLKLQKLLLETEYITQKNKSGVVEGYEWANSVTSKVTSVTVDKFLTFQVPRILFDEAMKELGHHHVKKVNKKR